MKRKVSALLAFLLLLSILSGCSKEKNSNALDGKKVIFIGNSHTYKGGVVNYISNENIKQEPRSNDLGLFYLLCQANNCQVQVTNWTFSGHGLQNLFGQSCSMNTPCGGQMHEAQLVDRYFDYVVVTPGVGTSSVQLLPDNMAYIKDFFLKENPNAKFICLGNASVYGHNKESAPYPGITGYYKTLEQEGWLIADWGRVVSDLITGEAQLPGTKESFTKNSFIVKDGFHPNMLSGYIATVMTYCMITGQPAANQSPTFFIDNPAFTGMIEQQVNGSYTLGQQDTNFNKVLLSESEMTGLLQLVDEQLAQKPYLNNEMP